MKVLYLVPAISYTSQGILKKQYDKIKAFEQAGCEVDALFFSSTLEHSFKEGNVYHVSTDQTEVRKKWAKTIIWRVLPYMLSKHTYSIIYKTITSSLDNVDMVYVRYSGTDLNFIPVLKLIKKRGIKIIFEYNGNHLYDEKVNVTATPSFFTYYHYLNEIMFQKRVTCFADIVVGVTHELTDFYAKFNPKATKYTLSNGVNVSRFLKRNQPEYSGNKVKFLFLSGSVNYWHGLDRFLNGLKNYSGQKQIEVTIAGPVHAEYKTSVFNNKNIRLNFIDSVEGEAFNDLFNTHHIGIGSLALHRMKLREASVLKVREYIVRGMPFILGYKDTDLQNAPDFKRFYFEVPPDDAPVDIEKVMTFANSVLSFDNHTDEMSSMGKPLVDYQPKIDGLVKVMNSLKK